jgi:ATP adenylyltransferase
VTVADPAASADQQAATEAGLHAQTRSRMQGATGTGMQAEVGMQAGLQGATGTGMQAEVGMQGGTDAGMQAQDGVGTPDGLARLWTPHRMAYVATPAAVGGDAAPACPFCRVPKLPDADGLVVARGEHVYAVLNLYPYNPGHLMVVPYRHVAEYTDADDDEVAELAEFTRHAMTVIRQVSGPHGFNIGINSGASAGAGIAGHLHQHVVPRWHGDANFMPVIGHTKVLPQLLGQTRDMIASAW